MEINSETATGRHQLQTYAASAKRNLVDACYNALCAGMALLRMHELNPQQLTDNAKSCNINKATAYRWMCAAHNACEYLEIADFHRIVIGSPQWEQLLEQFRSVAAEFSITRLQIGCAPKGDLMRMEIIQRQAETSPERSIYHQALDKVEAGDWTLVQAVRALGAQESSDKISEAKKHTNVLIDIDTDTGATVGIIPSALTRIKAAFAKWTELDESTKTLVRKEWKALLINKPEDL